MQQNKDTQNEASGHYFHVEISSIECLLVLLIGRLIDQLIDWLPGCLTDWLSTNHKLALWAGFLKAQLRYRSWISEIRLDLGSSKAFWQRIRIIFSKQTGRKVLT